METQILINYPAHLPDMLQLSPSAFANEAKMAMAVKLFEIKKLSSGMAAQLVGMDRVSFLLSLHLYNVAMISLDEDELQSDLDNT